MNHQPRQTKDLAKSLVLTGLKKAYGKKQVLHDISLKLAKGEIVGLLGANGCGKTTCFFIITGMLKADSGRVLLNGADISRLPMHKRSQLGLAYMPQEGSVFRYLSVKDNITAALEYRRDLSKQQRQEELQRLLGIFALESIQDSKCNILSGGEKRKTEIARLLAMAPDFILLDEPFIKVDPIAIGRIKDTLIYLAREQGIGILINDHNVQEILKLCDRSYVVGEGRIIAEGDAATVASNQLVRDSYLGKDFNL